MTTSTDDVLARLGLQTRMSTRDYLFPALGVFGLGLLVGAGFTVMLMPQMRQRLRDQLERGASRIKRTVRVAKKEAGEFAEDLESFTREELMERAKAMDIQTDSNMSKSELVQAIAAS